MRDLPVLPTGAPQFADHQLTGTFGECERMAYYDHVLSRRTRNTYATALDWGKTFHGCVEIIKTTPDFNQAISLVGEYIEANMFEDIDDRYGRTKQRMYEVLVKWVEFRHQNPIEVLRHEQPTVVKCDGSSPCPYYKEGCDLEYGGIMDEIVNWQGYVGPLDYKTTVMTDKDAANQYRMDHQMQGYDWIASHLMGQHCWGAIVERIITNKSKIEIGRFPISFSRSQIMEWIDNERVLQADFRYKLEHHANNESAWRQNRKRCWDPWPCHRRDICLTPRENGFRHRWLLDNTVERRWNFMARDEETEVDSAPVADIPKMRSDG